MAELTLQDSIQEDVSAYPEPAEEAAPSATSDIERLRDAVIHAESNGNPNAEGPMTRYGTAKGIMQLIDATGETQFGRLKEQGILNDESYEPYNEEQNKIIGTSVLKENYDTFQDPRLAAAAYNYNPHGVKELQKKYGSNYEDIEPHLPAETRKYVPRVMEAYNKSEDKTKSTPRASAEDFSIDTSNVAPNEQGFAQAALPIITNPKFEKLSFADKTKVIADAYKSKKWDPETYDLVEQAMRNIWDGADPKELPNLGEIVGGPPPIQLGQDPEKVTQDWKKEKTQELLREGISPALFGGRFEEYLNDASEEEKDAFIARSRGIVGSAANTSANFLRDIAKGAGYSVTKPIAGIARLARFDETADAIQTLPEYFGKPARDYLYVTDPDGHIVFNKDGTPQTRWASSIGQGIGQIGALIGGGAALKGLGYAQSTITAAVGGVNTLTLANDSFKEVFEETKGDTGKAYRAAVFSLPAAALGSIGELAIISKWSTPAVASLSNYNKAAYFANAFTRGAVIGAVSTGAMDATQQAGEISQTGKAFNTGRFGAAVISGSVASGVLNVRGGPRVIPSDPDVRPPTNAELNVEEPQRLLSAPETRTGLPAPETRTALPGRGEQGQISSQYRRGAESQAPIYAYGSPKDQVSVTSKLQAFQESEAVQATLSVEEAKAIPPEMLPLFQVDVTSDGQNAVVTKKETYVQRDGDTIEHVDQLISNLHKDLANSPSPNNVHAIVAERTVAKRQLAEQSVGINKSMEWAVETRGGLVKNLDKVKAQLEAEADPTLKQILKQDLAEAQADLQTFDDANAGVYDAYQKIGPLQERVNGLTEKVKNSLEPTYANDVKAKERNLNQLLRKRRELELKAEKAQGAETPPKYSKGVNVEGYSVIPSNNRWYVVDKAGNIVGHEYTYFGDAVNAVKAETQYSLPETSAKDTGFLLRDTTPDRTALTPEQQRAIEDRVAANQKIIEKITQNKEQARVKAEAYREALYRKEIAAQRRKAAMEDKARKKGQPKTPTVTALEGQEIGLQTEGEAVAAPKAETVEKKTLKPNALSQNRRRLSQAKKPLTSNYTQETQFTESGTKTVRPRDILKKVQDLVTKVSKDTRIFEGGRTSKNTLGFLNFVKNYVNIGRHNDPMTLLHEFKHVIDRALIGKWDTTGTPDYTHVPKPVLEAAKDMADTYYPAQLNSPTLRVQEGFAMFFQHHATGQPVRKEVLDWYNNTFAKEHPQVYKSMEEIKDLTHEFYNQTPLDFGASLIENKRNQTVDNVRESVNPTKLKDDWIDRVSILSEADRLTGGRSRFKDKYDANYRRSGSITEHLVDSGLTNFNGTKIEGMSLKEAISPAKGKEDLLGAYLTARRQDAYRKEGIEPGGNAADTLKQINQIEREHPDVVLAANNYYDWQLKVQDIVGNSSKGARAYIDSLQQANLQNTGTKHGYYVPFSRTGHASKSNPNARRTGSTRSVTDPLTNIKDSTENLIRKALDYQTHEQLVEWASGPEASSIGMLMREVTGKQKIGLEETYKNQMAEVLGADASNADKAFYAFSAEPLKGVSSTNFEVIPIMDGKKVRFYEVDPRVAKAYADQMPDLVNSFAFKYLWRPGAQLLRPMATTLRAGFQLKNAIFRDPITAWETIKTGEGGGRDALALGKNIIKSFIDAPLYHAGKSNDGWTALMARLGLTDATKLGAAREVQLEMQKKFGKNFLNMADATLTKLENFFSAGEVANRTAAARTVLEGLGVKDPNQPLTEAQALETILAFKRSTTNFQVQGRRARLINQGVPFFTARMAELTRLPDIVKNNPRRLLGYGAAMMTYGVYHALAHAGEKWYQEMEPSAKNNAIWFRENFGDAEKMIYVPLNAWSGLNFGLGQAIGTKMSQDNEVSPSYKELASAYISNASPVAHPEDLLTPWGKELLAQYSNYDSFTKRSVVPPNLEFQDPRLQFNEFTTELAKSVGSLTGVSPLRIDHAIKSTAPAIAGGLQFADVTTGNKAEPEYQGMNFVFRALSRAGTTSSVSDRSQRLFTEELIKARANQIAETPEEAVIRKSLEKINRETSDINTVVAGIDDQKLRDELRSKKRELLRNGIRLATLLDSEPVAPDKALAAEAKQIRKDKKSKLGGDLLLRKESLEASEKLKGSSE